jgi:nucleotide-binding universal stress UspA family protein
MNASAVTITILPEIELKRILYATDFSETSLAALPIVSAVARRYGSEVLIANISKPVPYPMVSPEVAGTLQYKDYSESRSKAGQLLAAKELAGLPAKIVVHSGSPIDELVRIAEKRHVDLAILATHGRVGLKHLFIGSVAEELFRRLPCPVLTVGPNVVKRSADGIKIKQILFPTDLSEASRLVFPYLASLAFEYSARVTLLHVLPVEAAIYPGAKSLTASPRKKMEYIASAMNPRGPVENIIDFGDTAERILAHAETKNVDLIGMGVRQASGIVTHLRNTVAYKVVLGAHCPVLTYRGRD